MRPLVSIVAICWNRKEDILESIERVGRTGYENFEVIIVDNASSDGTADEIKARMPFVRLIETYKNLGIEAYNIGFKNAKGKYIVILDDDSFPAADAVGKMVDIFEADESIGVVAFDVRSFYRYDEVSAPSGGGEGEARSKYTMGFNGAGAGIRRELFERIGFYPEEFFLYWNEQDTALRVLDAGYTIFSASDIVAYHKYSPKNRASVRAPFFYCRNAFWLVWKHFPLPVLLARTVELIYMCIFYGLEQQTLIYIRAMLAAFLDMHIPLKRRKPVKDEVWRNMRIPLVTSFMYYK